MKIEDITSRINTSVASRHEWSLDRTPLGHIKEIHQNYLKDTTDLLLYTEKVFCTLMNQIREGSNQPTFVMTTRWCAHTNYVSNVFTSAVPHAWPVWRTLACTFMDNINKAQVAAHKTEELAYDIACWAVLMDNFRNTYENAAVQACMERLISVAMQKVNLLLDGDMTKLERV